MFRRFLSGLNFLAISRRTIRETPRLKYIMVLPFVVQFVLLFVGLYFGFGQLQLLVAQAVTWIGFDSTQFVGAILYYLFLLISALIFSILYVYFIYVLAGILNTPFFSLMADMILKHRKSVVVEISWFQSLNLLVRNLGTSLLRSLVLLGFGIMLFVCSFVPGLNLIAAFCIFFLLACDSADYALEVLGTNLRQRVAFVRCMWPEFLGMSTFIGLTALIPGLILVVMPFAVIAATELVAIEKSSGRLGSGPLNDSRRNS